MDEGLGASGIDVAGGGSSWRLGEARDTVGPAWATPRTGAPEAPGRMSAPAPESTLGARPGASEAGAAVPGVGMRPPAPSNPRDDGETPASNVHREGTGPDNGDVETDRPGLTGLVELASATPPEDIRAGSGTGCGGGNWPRGTLIRRGSLPSAFLGGLLSATALGAGFAGGAGATDAGVTGALRGASGVPAGTATGSGASSPPEPHPPRSTSSTGEGGDIEHPASATRAASPIHGRRRVTAAQRRSDWRTPTMGWGVARSRRVLTENWAT